MPAGQPWTREETILVVNAYLNASSKSFDSKNKDALVLAEQINSLPGNEESPRTIGSIVFKLMNVRAIDPDEGGKGFPNVASMIREIWDEFHDDPEAMQRQVSTILGGAPRSSKPEPVRSLFDSLEETTEGERKLKLHYQRERNQQIVKLKKALVYQANGALECEVCGFDFGETYGPLGEGYIECHHLLPLSELNSVTITNVQDLALVCANCHRMLHREGNIPLEQLRASLTNQ